MYRNPIIYHSQLQRYHVDNRSTTCHKFHCNRGSGWSIRSGELGGRPGGRAGTGARLRGLRDERVRARPQRGAAVRESPPLAAPRHHGRAAPRPLTVELASDRARYTRSPHRPSPTSAAHTSPHRRATAPTLGKVSGSGATPSPRWLRCWRALYSAVSLHRRAGPDDARARVPRFPSDVHDDK